MTPTEQPEAGCLYVVATPIGNLEDITLRALRVLREADVIACEDTRETQKLLQRYEIQSRLVSYHEHNEMMRSAELIIELEQGAKVALVSDAGTPVISDPGHRLVSLCLRHDIPVVPVPGPSALVAALAASGLPTAEFLFVGFLPARAAPRRKALQRLAAEPRTIVFYEAPHRLKDMLADAAEILGPRRAVIAREVTKLHEEFLRGRAGEVLENLKAREAVKGEITLLIGKAEVSDARVGTGAPARLSVRERVEQIMAEEKVDEKAALKKVAKERGVSKSEAYRELQRSK